MRNCVKPTAMRMTAPAIRTAAMRLARRALATLESAAPLRVDSSRLPISTDTTSTRTTTRPITATGESSTPKR
jgi:hypothetical protein